MKVAPLLALNQVTLAFGGPPLLCGVDLQVERGERICLIGRNGTGKSSLLRLLHGELQPDSGAVSRPAGLKTALLPQEVPREVRGTVYEVVASGQGRQAELLTEYHRIAQALREGEGAGDSKRLGRIQQALEAENAWALHQRVQTITSRMGLNPDDSSETLSAGLKRRVYLAQALVSDPDVLLLDEPTNHLDLDSIVWMEQFLLHSVKTLVFVTHDRDFMDHLATRIVELDRGGLLSFPGRYSEYLARKEALLDIEAAQKAVFDKQLRGEEDWLRQGIKARRTRNEGRVRALMKMREEAARRRSLPGEVHLAPSDVERSGKMVLEARDVSFSYEGIPLIRGFSATILRGDKVGIIGPNGCGKTTLLRILLGDLEPGEGRVRQGTNLDVAYFDQLRAQLDPERTVQENIAAEGDTVMVGGKVRHVIGYLQDFLFTPEQARSPISRLSGGERNRLLLARLFTRPANLLVLDEPTNDLDMETLDLLEDMLVRFQGTVLFVSHDRAFLNHVAVSTLVFEDGGRVRGYVGGYDDWLRQRPAEELVPARPPKEKKPKARPAKTGPRKLTFKERRELACLPDFIDALEKERSGIFGAMADPSLYKTSGVEVARLKDRLQEVERELEKAMARWESLEELNQQAHL